MVLGLDFDGTLAPIVLDPAEARVEPETLSLLRRLAPVVLKLVLISGRDTDFLWDRVPIPDATFVGNHGLEERRNGTSRLIAQAGPYAANLQRAAEAVAALPEAAQSGVRIERKRAAISVHFRESRDREATGAALRPGLAALAIREHLLLHTGRQLFELRPAIEVNKGTVIAGLARSLKPGALLYIGDDLTDADAFKTMRRLRATRTLAVGVRSSEISPKVFGDCDLVLDGVNGVKTFLRELLAVG